MLVTPFVFRVGKRDPEHRELREAIFTADDRLPAVAEVEAGALMNSSTRVTEVRRETTDDN